MIDTPAIIQNFSGHEIAILALIIFLFFGAKRLPELFGSLGKSIGEFKKGMQEDISKPEPIPLQKSTLQEESKSI